MKKQHDVITYWKCHVSDHAKPKVKKIISQFLIKAKSYVTDGDEGGSLRFI